MYAYWPVSKTFDPWNDRKSPCPGGGPMTVTITDFPSLPIDPVRHPNINGIRTLKFRLVVKSSAGCGKGLRSATATAVQVLKMVNSKLVDADFTPGPTSTTRSVSSRRSVDRSPRRTAGVHPGVRSRAGGLGPFDGGPAVLGDEGPPAHEHAARIVEMLP
jgi:hypothetical protein